LASETVSTAKTRLSPFRTRFLGQPVGVLRENGCRESGKSGSLSGRVGVTVSTARLIAAS